MPPRSAAGATPVVRKLRLRPYATFACTSATSLVLGLALIALMPHLSVWADQPNRPDSSSELAGAFPDVAKIVSQRCLSCHNDDDLQGDLSLQSAESLAAGGITVVDPESSELLDAITGSNGQRPRMPKNGPPLSKQEVETIRRWIHAGAPWPSDVTIQPPGKFDWWSFKPLRRPCIPAVDDSAVRNPIDAFVLSKLQSKSLSANADADRRTLIRRVTYDLIGLPPSPSDVAAFVSDPDPLAYERLVDRLLASPHYGEHWARHWLDVVKYADTCGYDKDKLRPNAWPYRDYVVRSFNDDKPYGRFIQEQIAGDVLFPNSSDGIVATGFIAAGPWDFIGHVEVPESKIDGQVARNLDRDDMVSNTINTFCSVTIQCARCHDHKFDPFTQDHYYSLQAVFSAVDRADRRYAIDPAIEAKRRQYTDQIEQLKSKLQAIRNEMRTPAGETLDSLEKAIAEASTQIGVKKHDAFGYHSQFASTAEETKWVEIDLGRNVPVETIVLHPCHDTFGGIGAGFGFPVRLEIQTRADGQTSWQHLWATTDDIINPLLDPLTIPASTRVARHIRVTATKLAKRVDAYIFALAELEVLGSNDELLSRDAKVSALDSIENPARWAKSNLVDGHWPTVSNVDAYRRLVLATRRRAELITEFQTPQRMRRLKELQSQIDQFEKLRSALPEGKLVYAAATQFQPRGNFKPTGGKPRPVRLLHRGDVRQARHPVQPGRFPLATDDPWQWDASESEGQRRAALAHWLSSADHPLVWRSIVNRVWQYHFGRGLVDTPNDFGRMGSLPTHPELLDWLAMQFRDGDQSFKQLHRLIVTSSTYRRSSQWNLHNAKIDSNNQYLWRMNRRRLTAEEIRDSILAISDCLDRRMGGPGFYLFKLEKTDHSPHYEYHKFDPSDPASFRRSVYRFIVRSQPDPYMTTFDCADSSQSTPVRTETMTPLQALTLMNSKFNLVMAQRFAESLKKRAPSIDDQVRLGFSLATDRFPTDIEHQAMVSYARRHGLPNLCRALLNLNEFVFVD